MINPNIVFFIENSEKHMIDNIVLDIKFAKLYNKITEDINKKVQKQENIDLIINGEKYNNMLMYKIHLLIYLK